MSPSLWRSVDLVTRGGGACKPVVDRLAQAVERDRLDGDGGGPTAVERLQMGEQVGGRLAQIARLGKIAHRHRVPPAPGTVTAEGEQRLAPGHPIALEPHRGAPCT